MSYGAARATTATGPLLQTADPFARLCELHAQRDPLYREVADIIIDTGTQSLKNLVGKLEQRLERLGDPSTPPSQTGA